jgi:hypothetical protein
MVNVVRIVSTRIGSPLLVFGTVRGTKKRLLLPSTLPVVLAYCTPEIVLPSVQRYTLHNDYSTRSTKVYFI